RTVYVQMPSVAVSGLANSLDPREHADAKQQCCDVIDQLPTRRRVVDPSLADLCIPTHRSVGRPEMPQEKRHLVGWQCENWLGHELLVAAQSKQPKPIQPCGDRIASTVRQPIRGGQSQRSNA